MYEWTSVHGLQLTQTWFKSVNVYATYTTTVYGSRLKLFIIIKVENLENRPLCCQTYFSIIKRLWNKLGRLYNWYVITPSLLRLCSYYSSFLLLVMLCPWTLNFVIVILIIRFFFLKRALDVRFSYPMPIPLSTPITKRHSIPQLPRNGKKPTRVYINWIKDSLLIISWSVFRF